MERAYKDDTHILKVLDWIEPEEDAALKIKAKGEWETSMQVTSSNNPTTLSGLDASSIFKSSGDETKLALLH